MTRHDTDYLSLAFGLLFAAVAAVMLFGELGAISWEWVGPVAVIAIGAIVILAARPRRPIPADAGSDATE
jgi:membrane protein YdbS with pleckstrin-like domain